MKLYTKIIDGYVYVMPANKIVIIKDDMQIFNPTEDLLLADGWKAYAAPENELTEEQILIQEKESKVNDIVEYDSSDAVNIFYVNGIPMWLDKATRAGLMLRLQAESALGFEETNLWYDDFEFRLPISNAMQLLFALEVYASKCYDMTHWHIANINNIDNLQSLKAYDYKTGYPETLHFNF